MELESTTGRGVQIGFSLRAPKNLIRYLLFIEFKTEKCYGKKKPPKQLACSVSSPSIPSTAVDPIEGWGGRFRSEIKPTEAWKNYPENGTKRHVCRFVFLDFYSLNATRPAMVQRTPPQGDAARRRRRQGEREEKNSVPPRPTRNVLGTAGTRRCRLVRSRQRRALAVVGGRAAASKGKRRQCCRTS